MKINQSGLDLIKSFEGFRASPYICPAGVLTIGYGTTGKRVKAGMPPVTKATAEQWLREDVQVFEQAVDRLVTVPLTSNQFSALVSFVYNIGSGAFASSTLLKRLNAKLYSEAAAQFERWNKGGGKVLPGLTRRRQAEKALFLKPD